MLVSGKRPVNLDIQGNNVIVITIDCTNVDAALKLLGFLASDDGLKLVHYGIEGVDCNRVDDHMRLTLNVITTAKAGLACMQARPNYKEAADDETKNESKP